MTTKFSIRPITGSKGRLAQRVALGLAVACVLGWPAFVSAQVSRVGSSISALAPGGIMRGTDVAYDPVHGVFLLVVGNGPVYGVFVNSQGFPVTSGFVIMMNNASTWAHFPRAEYSPHVSNGVGGQGGFLVTWHHNVGSTNYVFGRLVSYPSPSRVVSGIQMISDGSEGGSWHETGPAMGYSKASGRFLVAWRTLHYGIRGRFVGTNGIPTGVTMPLENPGGSRDPSLTWNAATNEFGLAYTGFSNSGAFAAFRRIRASDGVVSARTTFGFSAGTFATGIDVNTATSNYVLTWALHPGTMAATFDRFGTQLTAHFVTGRLGFDQSLALSFNPTNGTFLAVSSDRDTFDVGGIQLGATGAPTALAQVITNGATLGSFHPMVAARPGSNQWNVVYSRDFRGATDQIVASGGGGGGGGTLPPPPPPPPPPSGCTTPDPFVSIGGGVCINGGWVPKTSSPAPAPTSPPPPSGGCTTPSPGSGWVCVNGGWLPPGHPLAVSSTPPPPSSGGCTTPDPFASLGGGQCINGGWVPITCVGPDPFVSIGGGVCINGGWVPRGAI